MSASVTASLKDVFEWDVETWKHALTIWDAEIDQYKKRNPSQTKFTALDVGARNGGLSLYLATKGIDVVCSDIRGIVPAAQDLHVRHQVQDRVQYEKIDATSIPYPDAHFDFVIFKSVLGGIAYHKEELGLKNALAEFHRVLKPGGRLLFAENTKASPLHGMLRNNFIKNRGDKVPWIYLPKQEIERLLKPYSRLVCKTKGALALIGRSERQRSLLAKADVILEKLIPQSFRYVLYGCAEK